MAQLELMLAILNKCKSSGLNKSQGLETQDKVISESLMAIFENSWRTGEMPEHQRKANNIQREKENQNKMLDMLEVYSITCKKK